MIARSKRVKVCQREIPGTKTICGTRRSGPTKLVPLEPEVEIKIEGPDGYKTLAVLYAVCPRCKCKYGIQKEDP